MLLIPKFMRAELTLALDSLTGIMALVLKYTPSAFIFYKRFQHRVVQSSVVMARNRYPTMRFSSDVLHIPLITWNRRANIEGTEKCIKVGYRLLSGFTTPSRHTSAMSENVRKDNIFVCELSWELYTLGDIEENLKSCRDSQPRDESAHLPIHRRLFWRFLME